MSSSLTDLIKRKKKKVSEANFLKSGERAVAALRSLYKQYGYLPFKMSKFEEYDLYVRNKEFLVGDRVITFNDTDGRLLAMKPDVTLSIIKNSVYEKGTKQKVYYNENVYRVSPKTKRFKEIMQSGIECIGDTDIFDTYEVVYLAIRSLSLVSEDCALDISHLGILSKLLARACDNDAFKQRITSLISEKNKHEISKACEDFSVSCEYAELIKEFIDMYGDMNSVLARLKPMCDKIGAAEQYAELSSLCRMLSDEGMEKRIRIDFSVVNDMNYYNGIVFKGFIRGIPDGVLSGGEYSSLMERMGKHSGAVGFALYLDFVEELTAVARDYDVDVLLLYSSDSDPVSLLKMKNKLISEGKSVSLQKAVPSKLRYRELIKLDK